MILDSMTTAQRDALTSTATGTIKIYAPTVDGVVNFAPMAGAIVKVNKFPLVEGVDWDADISAQATAVTLAAAITTATASTLCTASIDPGDNTNIIVRANTAGAAGNSIHISCFMPQYTFPSGGPLTGGASPTKGDLIYNSTTNKANLRAATAWEAVTSA